MSISIIFIIFILIMMVNVLYAIRFFSVPPSESIVSFTLMSLPRFEEHLEKGL